MGRLNALETKIGEFYKSAPALPKDAKKTIVQYWPIVALVLGVLQLLAAWALWGAYRTVTRTSDFVNEFARYYTGNDIGISEFDKVLMFAGIAVLAISGGIMIAAYGPLKAKAKKGWDLLFLGLLVGALYSVLSIFVHGQGIGTFIMNLVGVAIGLYFLYQIRDAYTAKSK